MFSHLLSVLAGVFVCFAQEEYRIPAGFYKPDIYHVNLDLTDELLANDTFKGTVRLYFFVLQDTDVLYVHASDKLQFSAVTITHNMVEQVLNDTSFVPDSLTEILTIRFNEPLLASSTIPYFATFVYTGQIVTDAMYGLYRSEYLDVDGTTHSIITTQFGLTYARYVLPCFDEPSYKGKFTFVLTHSSRFSSSLSNTVPASTTTNGGNVVTTFESTPYMSSYLAAFVISDYTCTSTIIQTGNAAFKVCSAPDLEDSRALAVEKGPQLVRILEEFTGITYTESGLKKLDLVAIPDFAFGAMENWGLITFRETALLWNPEESSNQFKQSVVTTIAHELSHMWFGDLVTTHWWSDTFLNEGFATFCQYYITAQLEPEWELSSQFVTKVLQPALAADGTTGYDALSHQVSSPAEIMTRFNIISYEKGASILRMFYSVMGPANFQTATSAYLTKFKSTNAKPEDLWEIFDSHTTNLPAGLKLATVMDNWMNEPGYPLLTVTVAGRNITIAQEPFRRTSDGTENKLWYVPISYTLATDNDKFDDTTPKEFLVPTQSLTLELVLGELTSWIVLNNQVTGYYRVNYDDLLWNRIQTALNKPGFDSIGELNRAQMIDDLHHFARNDIEPYTRLLNMASFLAKDTSYYSWYSAFNAFDYILNKISDQVLKEKLSTHILSLMDTLYNSFPYEKPKEESQIYTLNRVQAQTWACRLSLPHCVDNAVAAFEAYRNNDKITDKNLRSVILCSALRHGNNEQTNWNHVWDKYQETKTATERSIILNALGCTKNETILNEYLKKSIDATSGIRSQDALAVYLAVVNGNDEGIEVGLDFLLDYYMEITAHYTSSNSISGLVNGLANRLNKKEHMYKLIEFLTARNIPEDLRLAVVKGIITVENNLKTIPILEQELTEFFSDPPVDEVPSSDLRQSPFGVLFIFLITILAYFIN